ncbi:hypothetical protein Kpol_388p4 [Vanderwaltozyma polyspora DSM 70294]|uniref:Vacuolar protein sorting-associated protein n=1 Tax=Vanderwaltozyma polyspora (strain ATCC 22028 / DSM 70294 / BCRC 21397 / CBS 2163 / NBRC 10782 / NRRL Y-8283 / UCD 57-17) TaxID=436907 RepID=A7TRZ3_VANPO|nr:uncharacterized protein Kpol_388p4 [Vanderwaltozyma polyspora DSM 70294]EDO14961.1 hypothetical protein Kpol_388p4 [Vanderwaltozyma polyspora DSM 70294]
MLESLAANLLNRLLGAYVENFDPKQLDVGIWSGDVLLKNLKLRNDCLDALNLPINVKFGVLGNLVLTVPWSSLKNKPVKIMIEDCYLLCNPRDPSDYNEKEQIEREFRLKLNKLAQWELSNTARLNNSATEKGKDDNNNESFMQSLLTKVVDNLQITIKNIHIRYEDEHCIFSKDPCSIGITLNELSAISTDSDWNPSFISIATNVTHKLMTLNSLCFYWNIQKDLSNLKFDNSTDIAEIINNFRDSISSNDKLVDNNKYVLKPITGTGRLSVNKLGSTESRPHIDLQMIYDEFGVELGDIEYANLLHILSSININNKIFKFKINRPQFSVSEDPKAWFAYTATTVLNEVKQKYEIWTWEHIKKRCDQRREYIRLWLQKLKLPNLNNPLPDEKNQKALDQLEHDLQYEDIILFRSIARKMYIQLLKESSRDNTPTPQAAQNSASTWFSSFWTGKSDNTKELQMTDEQRKELYEAIEFTENDTVINNIQIPKETVTFRVTSFLKKGSFCITKREQNMKLGEMIFEECYFEFLQRPESHMTSFKLQKFIFEDGSPNTLYKHIISVKNLNGNEEVTNSTKIHPLFEAFYEDNPLDGSADSKIGVKLRGMTIFYHVHFINEVLRFFNPPKQHMNTIGAIINAAEATVEGWTSQTRMGLEALLEEHRTVNINLDLQAPLIILPLDPHSWDTPCAVIDAGHITLLSDLVSKDKIKVIKEMSIEEYDKIDGSEINRLMFDRFQLCSQDTQILIGPDVRSTLSSLSKEDPDDRFSILDKMRLELSVDISILPRAYNLPRIRTFGRLPTLNLSLNDYQYNIIMQLIAKCIPSGVNIDDNDEFSNFFNSAETDEKRKYELQLTETFRMLKGMSDAEIDQKFMDICFDIESINMSVYQCTDNATMNGRKLIEILGNQLKFNFIKKAKEMTFDISMHSLDVIDYIIKSGEGELKRLISSEGISAAEDKHLFSLYYVRQQRIVEHENILIEIFDQDVRIDMAKLHLGLTPKSILTLFNYAITTFTDPTATDMPADALRHNSEDREDAPQKIIMLVKMAGVTIDFNDDSSKLATWILTAAEFSLLMLPEKMKFGLKLGGMELIDASVLNADGQEFSRLISMDDEELVEFSYETFDPTENKNNYDSLLIYKAASMHVTFVEESINKIMNYFYKFLRMKSLFEKAREVAYNQTPSIDAVNNMKLSINVKSPLITFPRESDYENGKYDTIDFYLGDFYVENHFTQIELDHKVNHMKLGIKEGSFSSKIWIHTGEMQNFDIVKDMGLTFNIDHDPIALDTDPKFKIDGIFDALRASLTEIQLHYLFSIWGRIFLAFQVKEVDLSELDEEVGYVNEIVENSSDDSASNSRAHSPENPSDVANGNGIYVDFTFRAPETSLTLYNKTASCTTLKKYGLTRFKFEDIGFNFILKNDDSLDGSSHIDSFTIEDIRNLKDNKHTELVPKISGSKYQFTSNINRKCIDGDLFTTFSITIDNPLVIIAMDYLFELKNFYDNSFGIPTKVMIPNTPVPYTTELDMTKTFDQLETQNKFQYIFNMVNPQVMLLADPSDIESEAVVFKVGQFQVASQNITTVMANNVGVFLSKMNSPKATNVRLLDDFSSSIVIDQRSSTVEKLLTEIQASVQPLLMRISLRDIRLAMLIFNRAVSLLSKSEYFSGNPNERSSNSSSGSNSSKEDINSTNTEIIENTFSNPNTKNKSSDSLTKSTTVATNYGSNSIVTVQAENLNIEMGGLRLVLIGDIHEMPILDMNVNAFEITAKDWSTELDALATLETYVNVFNYSRSSWEPLIEPVPISFHLSKGLDKDAAIMFDIITRKVAEITLSTRSISMLSQIPSSLSGELTLRPRGSEKPYLLHNDTGLDLDVWIITESADEKKNLVTLKSGTSLPWEFEDWRTVREKLDIDNKRNMLGIAISGTSYKTRMKIDATYEGELMFVLQPAFNEIHNRLICDLKCSDDNIKEITFRSTLTLENSTDTEIQFVFGSETSEETVYTILPLEIRSIPIEKVYYSKIHIKPSGSEFDWSEQTLYWKDLLSDPLSVQCSAVGEDDRKFYFEVNAKYDKREPLAQIFPRMKIIISSPLVIENLLPCGFNFSLFDKRDGGNSFKYLEKNGKITIHDVSLDNFLLFSVQPLMDDAMVSKASIINTPSESALTPENTLTLSLNGGQRLNLKIAYHSVEGTRAKILKIYSPYIIFNGTGKDLYIQDNNKNITQSKLISSEESDGADDDEPYTTAKMFSFTDLGYKNNRAKIRFKDTDWSIPLSFDAIGQSFDGILNIPNKEQESNVGIHIVDGEGEYSLSKLIEIAPRYIVHNDLEIPLELCEFGSTNIVELEPDDSIPMYKMRNIVNKQLQIKFLGSKSDWSAPFYIKDIGFTYLKVLQENSTHKLLKVEIVLDKATIFIRIKDGGNCWPYSIRNLSDHEFIFYQRDPKIIDDYYETEDDEESGLVEYKPLYYRVPSSSIMPYAWDYPAARQKKLILSAKGRKREIQLAEIGNLTPMRLPGALPTDASESVELNVIADGPTQVLVITNYSRESSLYKLKSKQSMSSISVNSSKEVFEAKETDEKIFRKVVVSFKGLGLSLINAQLQELLYVNLRGIELKYTESDLYQTFSWKMKWMQIDNQLFGANFPNVLYPTAIPDNKNENENHPVLYGSISKVKDDTHGVVYFKHLTVLLQELSLQLDEDFLFSLLDFTKFPGAAWNKDSQTVTYKDQVRLPEFKEVQFSEDTYFELFHIQPTMLHLSFVRSERLNYIEEEEKKMMEKRSTLLFLVNILTMTIGNVNDAPIRMNSLYMDNLRVPVSTLINSIKTHYGQQFVYQLHKILGSADFLGNPVGLFNTISSGVWDIFYEPYKGYMMNDRPGEIGIYLAKGGLSFAKKTVFGLSDSMAKFTGSVAKGLSVTQDSEFQESRRLQQRINNNSRNVLATSAQSFANTIGSGISGMALDPYKGAQKEGAAGFIKGLGKGIFGLPTKTAIGILDLTNNLSQGVKSTTTVLDTSIPYRVRMARYIGHDQIIKPYNLRESQGQYWLKSCNGGLYMSDHYLTHVVLPGRELAVAVSMEHIVEVRIASEEAMWATAYQEIQGIVLEKTGIYIKLKSQAEYFIPIQDPIERKHVYKNIAIAVTEYNKYCEATL